jgi:hypothetical protein
MQAFTADMLHRGSDEFDYRVDVCRVTQHALQAFTADMLHRGWDEFDYRVDVCRVTQRHFRSLQLTCLTGSGMSLIKVWICDAWRSMHCGPLQRTCYTGAGISVINMWMCVVWPKVPAGHYSWHATPGLELVWLRCGCVSCDPRCLQAITADMLHGGWDEFDYRVDVWRATQSALQAITADMLHRVWNKFNYRVDVCRVTQHALQAITPGKLHRCGMSVMNIWMFVVWTSMYWRPLQRACYTGDGMSVITVWMCAVWPSMHCRPLQQTCYTGLGWVWLPRGCVMWPSMHCSPLQRTCYTGAGMSLVTVRMCVVWPRVTAGHYSWHATRVLDEFDYRVDVCRVTQGAMQAFRADMLHRGWGVFDYRVDVCRVT